MRTILRNRQTGILCCLIACLVALGACQEKKLAKTPITEQAGDDFVLVGFKEAEWDKVK